VRANPAWAATARSAKSWTAELAASSPPDEPGGGTGNGATGTTRSPERWSRPRLVARTRRCGQAANRSAISGADGSRCSTLSRTSKRGPRRSSVTTWSNGGRSGSVRRLRARAIAAGTNVARETGASGTRSTRSGPRSTRARATAIASRVLPTPPGPVNVTSRCSPWRRATTRPISPSRPSSEVKGAGRSDAVATERSVGSALGIGSGLIRDRSPSVVVDTAASLVDAGGSSWGHLRGLVAVVSIGGGPIMPRFGPATGGGGQRPLLARVAAGGAASV